MKYSTYNSLLTGKKTMLVVSKGKCGYANYRELKITLRANVWTWSINDSYNNLASGSYNGDKALKSVVNLAWGRA